MLPLPGRHPRHPHRQAHRPAYGTDGDYFSKPQRGGRGEKVMAVVAEEQASSIPIPLRNTLHQLE